MFGQSFFASKLVRCLAEKLGVEDDTARLLGYAAGFVFTVVTLDIAGGVAMGHDMSADSGSDSGGASHNE